MYDDDTVEKIEKLTGHKHHFTFYDNHDDTFDTLRHFNNPRPYMLRGTVWECECGAREIRFIVWNGKFYRDMELNKK